MNRLSCVLFCAVTRSARIFDSSLPVSSLVDAVVVEARIEGAQRLVDEPPLVAEVERLIADADAVDEADGRIEIVLDLARAEAAAPTDAVRHAHADAERAIVVVGERAFVRLLKPTLSVS